MTGDSASTDGPVVIIGGGPARLATLSKFQPDRSVVMIAEPDVVRKRRLHGAVANSATLRELVEWEFQLEGAADAFYHRYRELRPSAVVPISEYGVPFAARLAERCGVVGAGYGAALALRDKALQRRVTAAAGIPNPRSVAVSGPAEVRAFLAEIGAPIVLKPANRQSAVGTMIVHRPAEVDTAWAACIDQDEGTFMPDRPMPLRMLAEQFVGGDEFSVEMMVDRGRSAFGAVTRKFLFDGARPVEQGHLHPADIDQPLTDRLLADTERVIDAVGMDSGFVHCEWMVADGTPYLIECAGRMAGDWIKDLITLAWQYDVLRSYHEMMKGEQPADPPPAPTGYAAIWMAAAPAAGEVESVDGVDEAKAAAGVREVIAIGVGEQTHELRCSWDRVSGVIATGPTPGEALANAQQADGIIKVNVREGARRAAAAVGG